MARDGIVTCCIEGGEIVIRFGVGYLAHVAELSSDLEHCDETLAEFFSPQVTDEDVFAAEVLKELKAEEEDGTTCIHRALDQAIINAVENGCEGIRLGDDIAREQRQSDPDADALLQRLETGSGPDRVEAFVRASNAIEGIVRDPLDSEIDATRKFLALGVLTLGDLQSLQAAYAPGKPIRDRVGMNVRVADHIAPMGGRSILVELMTIIGKINRARSHGFYDPWKLHCAFEELHPFMDGNGRTGRALWAWHMLAIGHDPFALPFLHRFYYQTLSNYRGAKND